MMQPPRLGEWRGRGALRLPGFVRKLIGKPDRERALADYRLLAPGYDGNVGRIEAIRRDAIDSLRLKRGDAVLDVACGTGESLALLHGRVQPGGRVVGVEQSPEMGAIALDRLRRLGLDGKVELIISPVEAMPARPKFDAMLMSFAHDVLQSPPAVVRLLDQARDGTRVAIAGMVFLPWWWGAPVNFYNAMRARRYLTTFRGLRRPWAPLAAACPDLSVAQRYLLGSCYRAIGTVRADSSRDPSA